MQALIAQQQQPLQIVRGTVFDGQGRAVEGARVRVENLRIGAITDAKGRYTLRVQPGTYMLIASYLSFIPVRKTVEVSALSPSSSIDFIFQEKGVVSEHVLVRALRAEANTPVAQTAITPAFLDATFQGQDPQFLLERTVPSLISFSEAGTSFSNYGSFRLRGIDQTRINITINGVPLNDMIDQGVFFSNVTDLTNSIRTMQVQRGVGTSSNGTSSYGGSINLESVNLHETASPQVELQMSTGAFGLARGSIELRTGVMPSNVSVYAKYGTFMTDGYRYNTGTRSQSVFVSGAYFAENHLIKITGFLGRTQNRLAYFAVPKPRIDQDPRTNINDSSDRDDFGQHLLQLEYTYALSNKSTFAASAYYGGAGGDFLTGFRDTAGMLMQINYPLRNDHIGVMASLTTANEDNTLDVTFGIHAYTFMRKNWETLMPDYTSKYYEDRTTKNEASAFAKVNYRIDKLTLYGDVQARYAEMHFIPDTRALSRTVSLPIHTWLFVNPKIGATVQADDYMSIYCSFGRTGREPTRFDMLGSTQIVDANVHVLATPHTVRPEFVNDVEGGIRLSGGSYTAQLNGFYMQFQDEIAAIGPFIPQGFVQLRKNVPSSYRTGVELEADVELHETVNIRAHATWMTASISEYAPENLGINQIFRNVRPVQTPSIMGSVIVQFRPLPTLTLECSGRYVGESFLELTNTPSLTLPAFSVVDTRVEWHFVGEHRVNLALNNIFNALYFTGGGITEFGGRTVPAYFVQPPRHLIATVHFKL